MKTIHKFTACVAIALAATSIGTGIAADGKTIQGEPFVSGGVSTDERESLQKARTKYALFVQTAAKSGPFLADVEVRITDKAGKPVLETKLDGPWLLVNLKLGEYKVTANYAGKTQEKWTNIHRGDNHEMVFYFDETVETLKKGEKP
jgi:hypothetical protein